MNFLRAEEAKTYISKEAAPELAPILWHSYETLCFRMAGTSLESDFDVLFHIQLLERTLTEKSDQLASALLLFHTRDSDKLDDV